METTEGADVIRHAVVLDTAVDEAFKIFTEQFNDWWPAVYTFAGDELDTIGIECTPGGRCYERSRDGSELIWGEVHVCDAPNRIVFSWWISPERTIEQIREQVSEIEVLFSPADGGTMVELEHRHLSRHSGDWQMMQVAMASQEGWPSLLQAFADRASARD